MTIVINNPVLSTQIFIAIFLVVLLASIRLKSTKELFTLTQTMELKGLAILAVIFSHVGYSLSSDQRFMFPLSIMAGVGVNLFLFLSGYGLVVSALKKDLSTLEFYRKRLLKLFVSLWLVLSCFFLLDYFALHIVRDYSYILRSYFGFFSRADLFSDVNSPLWFITPIVFYYLLFPLFFFKQRPWLSAIIIYALAYLALHVPNGVTVDTLHLYELHLVAFPLGIAAASLANHLATVEIWLEKIKPGAYYLIVTILLVAIGYTGYYSGVGTSLEQEQWTSLFTMSCLLVLFLIKKIEIRFLSYFGILAYEIYLVHWPIMSRYDVLFKYLPAWLAMVLYLGLFVGLAELLIRVNNWLFTPRKNS